MIKKDNKTTMKISLTLRNKLTTMKYSLGCNNLEEVIEKMVKVMNKFKLKAELKSIGDKSNSVREKAIKSGRKNK